MLRSPSPNGAPFTAGGGPELSSNDFNLSALENSNRWPPVAEGPLPSSEQPPADSDVLHVSRPPLNPWSKIFLPPPPVAAQTLAAAERSEISRRLLWSITASLAFLALVGVQLARNAPHGEINPLKLLKVVTSTSSYIFILLLLPFTHQIRKIELGVFVGIVLNSLVFSVPIGLALYSEDGWELIMVNLIFLHIMALVNSAVVSIKHFDVANIILTVVLNPLLFVADKHEKFGLAFRLIYMYYFTYSKAWIKFLRHFVAKMKVPEFPEVVWRVRDVLADVSGDYLRKGTSCIYEPLLRSCVSKISSLTQEKGSGGQGPSKQLAEQTFVGPRSDAV
ncbi:dynamin-like 3 [Striga asiatica]|uniref:Dynamin-like 3 n=1 Tax=Striga asiatica TaxID=4170 RepID=A0A5A7P591_STRAF|nr:dynamin-like 3 [Striga asiatica]